MSELWWSSVLFVCKAVYGRLVLRSWESDGKLKKEDALSFERRIMVLAEWFALNTSLPLPIVHLLENRSVSSVIVGLIRCLKGLFTNYCRRFQGEITKKSKWATRACKILMRSVEQCRQSTRIENLFLANI